MHRSLPILAACGAALALGVSAQAEAPGGGQCFSPLQISATQPVGNRQINISMRNRDVYRIDLSAPCENLTSPSRVIEISPVASAISVCSPGELTVAAIVDGSRQECFIDKVTRLSPAEVAALPRRDRP